MIRPESPTGSSASNPRTGRSAVQPLSYVDTVRDECELCESVKPIQERYDMSVCSRCEAKYLP